MATDSEVRPAPDTLLALDAATVTIGTTQILKGITVHLSPGDVVLLAGKNGAGKSTLMRTLAQETPLTSGRLICRDTRRAAILGDVATLYDLLTVREHVDFFGRFYGNGTDPDTVLESAGLGHLSQSYGRELSLGERQRLSLALLLLGDPGIIFMDEPFNGLDVAGVKSLRSIIRDLADDGRSVVVISHALDHVAHVASRLWLLDRGELIADLAFDSSDKAWLEEKLA